MHFRTCANRAVGEIAAPPPHDIAPLWCRYQFRNPLFYRTYFALAGDIEMLKKKSSTIGGIGRSIQFFLNFWGV